ncbi:MAG: hypothetical protein LQ338_007330 [Usnochroma carphineum]|nr:MAG: hypothetical protein LQ338_007330 [Usnochroma carphineum]
MKWHYEIEYPRKPIKCVLTSSGESSTEAPSQDLVFTHGAGGTLESDAVANFVEGFASSGSAILCFQGNMNLQSRVKMFKVVIESGDHEGSITCVGGRSMGARAAIMAAPTGISHYVLVSYPLHTDKDVRDGILLELPDTAKVIFVSGDKDNMCEISQLDAVRKKMQCLTWRIVVGGADHGMTVTPKAGTKAVGLKTGEVVAEWLGGENLNDNHEGKITWNEETEQAQWTGWQGEN